MSAASRRLPERPSLEQLRKQAKEHLDVLRAANPAASLADAQYALAREYGFESWPRLVHHVEGVLASGRALQFDRLARDFVSGWHGDGESLDRLGAHFGASYDRAQLLVRVRSKVEDEIGAGKEPTLDDARGFVARHYGHASWAAFAQALAQPPADAASPRFGISGAPPFYRINWQDRTLEPQPPLADGDWDSLLDVMEEHGLTGISCPALTDKAFERISRRAFVTRIGLDGGQRFSDDGLLKLAATPQLEELDLSGWHSPLTDRGLEVLRHLPRLRKFTACWPQKISDAGTANLSYCERLEEVDLLGTITGDGTINALRGRRLNRFTTGRQVTDAGIPLLHDFPAFKTWQGGDVTYSPLDFAPHAPDKLTIDGPITDEGLKRLAGLDGVVCLSLFWHSKSYSGQGLAALKGLANLRWLGIDGDRGTTDALRSIAMLPRLRVLMCQGAESGDDGWEALSASKTLEHIWGRDCPNFGGRGLRALAAMPALRGLAISLKRVDDASLGALPSFPALKALMPMDVTDAGFRHVGACLGLEHLWCMYCRDIGDEATSHLSRLSKLRNYYNGKTRITDKSCEVLAGLLALEKLEFWQCAGLSDAGMATLARLPRMREISVEGSPKVTQQGMQVFGAGVKVGYSA